MIAIRAGLFETNSSSSHALCMYNGDYPLSRETYFSDAKKHVTEPYAQFIIKDFKIPDVCVTFYDKVRALMVMIAQDYWSRHYKYEDGWYMPEQLMGEYPLSKYPLLVTAVIDCLAEEGIECSDLNIEYPPIEQKFDDGEWAHKPFVIRVDTNFRDEFLSYSGLKSKEDFQRLLNDPSMFITYLECVPEHKGFWECGVFDRRQYEESKNDSY